MKKTQFVDEFEVCPELQPVIHSKFKGPRSVDSKVSHYACIAIGRGKKCIRPEKDSVLSLPESKSVHHDPKPKVKAGRCIIAKIEKEVK